MTRPLACSRSGAGAKPQWKPPLTRCLLVCKAVPSTRTDDVRPVFEAAFQAYGLPTAIRSDNGPPFASTGVATATLV